MTQIDKSTKIVKADDKSIVMKIENVNDLDFFFPIDGSMLQDVQPANKKTHKWTLMEILQMIGQNYELWDEPDEGLYIYDGSSTQMNPIFKTGMSKAELTGNVLYVGDFDRIELEVLFNSYSCRQLRVDMLMSKDDYAFQAKEVDYVYTINPEIIEPLNPHLKKELKYTPDELTSLCGGYQYTGTRLPVMVPGLIKMMIHAKNADDANEYLNIPASVIARKLIYGPAAMISINHLDNII